MGTNTMWGQPPRLTTDASGNMVLVGADGITSVIHQLAGEFFARPLSYTEITSGAPVKLNFDDVIVDDLNIYNLTDHTLDIPLDIVRVDIEYACELASLASTFGSSTGTVRAMLMNDFSGSAITGLGALACTRVDMDGGTYSKFSMSVPIDPYAMGLAQVRVNPRFVQDSGVTIRVGDSSGTGRSQTYIKMRLYRS